MALECQNVRQLCPADFHAETSSVLVATQAQSRRVISRLAKALESPENFQLFAIYKDAVVIGAVCYEISRSYISAAGSLNVEAARIVVAELRDESGMKLTRLQGCDGPPGVVEALGSACKEAFGCDAHIRDSVETMILDQDPHPCVGVAGILRVVASNSKVLSMLALWFEQFEKDTDNQCFSLEGRHQVMADLADAASRQDLFTWEVKEKPVAMLILGRSQPKQVLCVYTPAHQRSKGFGQALTAAVCEELRRKSGGTEPVILSAIHKFGAGRVYERVGFRSAGWLYAMSFEDRPCETTSTTATSQIAATVAAAGAKEGKISMADLDTDADSSVATDVDEADTDEDLDLDADWFDLETDPAKLFAASNAVLQCSW